MTRHGRILAFGVSLMAGLAPVQIASAQMPLPGIAQLDWAIAELPEDLSKIRMLRKEALLFAKVRPRGLVQTDADIVRGTAKSPIPAGTVFAQSRLGKKAVVCEPGRRKGQGSFACLADTDGDGAFDHFGSVNAKSYGYGSSTQIGFLVGMVKIDGWTAMETPVTASAIADDASPETMEMTLTLTSSPAKWSKSGARFMLCADRNEGNNIWGAPIVVPYCTGMLRFGAGATGTAQPLFSNGRLIVHAASADAVEVSIEGLMVGTSI